MVLQRLCGFHKIGKIPMENAKWGISFRAHASRSYVHSIVTVSSFWFMCALIFLFCCSGSATRSTTDIYSLFQYFTF